MPHDIAEVIRRLNSSSRSCVRATSIPPLIGVHARARCTGAALSSVSAVISFEWSTGKMKLDACPVEPPGLGSGTLVQQHEVAPAEPRQVIDHAVADDAGADDDRFRARGEVRHRSHRGDPTSCSSCRSSPSVPTSRTSSRRPMQLGRVLRLDAQLRRRLAGRARARACSGRSRRRAARAGAAGRATLRVEGPRRGSRSGSTCRAPRPSASRTSSRGEHVVAVVSLEPRRPAPQHLVERAVGAAVGVRDRDARRAPRSRSSAVDRGAIRSGRLCSSGGSGRTSTSQPRRRAIASHVERERAAGDDRPASYREPQLVDEQVVEVGAAGELDVLDLVDDRGRAAARSCTESAAIFAPSPAMLPAETMRVSGSLGRARSGSRSPARGRSRTSRRAAPARCPRARCRARASRMFQPVAIDALANCSSRTSRCER